MRYPASEKLEIIRLVEQSHLPVGRTLEHLGIPRATFYRWYDRYQAGGPEALDDRSPRPDRAWNRIPDNVREKIKSWRWRSRHCHPGSLPSVFVSFASFERLNAERFDPECCHRRNRAKLWRSQHMLCC